MGRVRLAASRRKYADRTRWMRVTKRTFTVKEVESRAFKGYVTRLEILKVKKPLYVSEFGKRFAIADNGYTWLQHFPKGERYCLSTMFTAKGKVAQWYLDIAHKTGVSDEGIPWWDDLYLDIIIVPDKGAQIVDEDDLEQALAKNKISKHMAKEARAEAKRLKALIDEYEFPLLALSEKHFKRFEKL